MPIIVLLVFKAIFEAVRLLRNKAAKPKADSLCTACSHAHIQFGANARRTISCTYGGAVRSIKLDVLYCTDYQARCGPACSRAIGFVRETLAGEHG